MFNHQKESVGKVAEGITVPSDLITRRRDTTLGIGMPKNNSENCLTIQVPRLYENDNPIVEPRKSHSSPTRHPQRRRYSQGSVFVGSHFSVLNGDEELERNTTRSSSSPTPPQWAFEEDLLRHSTEFIPSYLDNSNPFPSSVHLLDQEETTTTSGRSSTASESRRKVSKTPQERLNKLAKRHWPEDNLIPLDDICESPLVKTPNEPAQWSAETNSVLQQPSTTTTLFALDSVSASLQLDKG